MANVSYKNFEVTVLKRLGEAFGSEGEDFGVKFESGDYSIKYKIIGSYLVPGRFTNIETPPCFEDGFTLKAKVANPVWGRANLKPLITFVATDSHMDICISIGAGCILEPMKIVIHDNRAYEDTWGWKVDDVTSPKSSLNLRASFDFNDEEELFNKLNKLCDVLTQDEKMELFLALAQELVQ